MMPPSTDPISPRPPVPPFTRETAAQKVRLAEDAWNTREPQRVALAYTVDTIWRDDAGNWFRSYGNENWEFDGYGYMHRRFASINDKPIAAIDRKFHWPQGRRPDKHTGLNELGL